MILAKKLSYTYPGAKEKVLYDLDFEIEEAEIFGFLGPSGSGKSTTQKILYKILHDFEGEVLIENKPIQDWGFKTTHKNFLTFCKKIQAY